MLNKYLKPNKSTEKIKGQNWQFTIKITCGFNKIAVCQS